MTLPEAVFARLSGQAGLTALVGTRIHPNIAPQNVAYPAITFRRVSSIRVSAMGSDTKVTRARVQFDTWAATYASANAVREQLRPALQRWRGTDAGVVIQDVFLETDAELYDSARDLHHFVLDAEIIHEEA